MGALTTALLVVVLASGCSNTESDRVAELQLEMNAEKPTATPTTQPSPTTEPTPTTEPPPTNEPTPTTKPPPGDCADLANSYVPVVNPGVPPFSGTLWISPDIMSASDPTSFIELEYSGQKDRMMFDRRTGQFGTVNAHIFEARYGTSTMVEIQVNPEFDVANAEQEALFYATAIGRMPAFLFTDLETVWIHAGDKPAGGGNNNLLIHTAVSYTHLRAHET